jgi:hypothetical protein
MEPDFVAAHPVNLQAEGVFAGCHEEGLGATLSDLPQDLPIEDDDVGAATVPPGSMLPPQLDRGLGRRFVTDVVGAVRTHVVSIPGVTLPAM